MLSYAKNIGLRRAISSGNIEELYIIWQPQIKNCVKSYLDLPAIIISIISFIMLSIICFFLKKPIPEYKIVH